MSQQVVDTRRPVREKRAHRKVDVMTQSHSRLAGKGKTENKPANHYYITDQPYIYSILFKQELSREYGEYLGSIREQIIKRGKDLKYWTRTGSSFLSDSQIITTKQTGQIM